MSYRRTLTALLVLVALTAAAPAFAPSASHAAVAPRADFADVEDEVMCDTCNVALYIAESPRADQLRAEIRDLIAEGRTKAQIKAQLKSQYGPNILATPDRSGLGFLAYVLPVAFAGGLLALLALLLPRWRRRSGAQRAAEAAAGTGDALSDADRRRLDDELARFDA